MVVEIGEQLAVLPQPLVEPGTVLNVELDSFLADDRLYLAHVSIVSAAPANPATACPVLPFYQVALLVGGRIAGIRPGSRMAGRSLAEPACASW